MSFNQNYEKHSAKKSKNNGLCTQLLRKLFGLVNKIALTWIVLNIKKSIIYLEKREPVIKIGVSFRF